MIRQFTEMVILLDRVNSLVMFFSFRETEDFLEFVRKDISYLFTEPTQIEEYKSNTECLWRCIRKRKEGTMVAFRQAHCTCKRRCEC